MSRIGLIGDNSVEYVNLLLDIWNNGNCAVLLDWRIPIKTSIEMMKEAGVEFCYIEHGKKDTLDKLSDACNIKFIKYYVIANRCCLIDSSVHDKFFENYSNNEAVIIYSSGTTGKAKGIILSHFAINTNANSIIKYMQLTANDRIYLAKSISHSSTLVGELLTGLISKASIIIAPTIVSMEYVLNNIERFNVNIICLNPTLLSCFLDEYKYKKDRGLTTSLKTIYVSGSILYDKLYLEAHRVLKDIPIYNVYGLSEAGPRVTAQREDCCKTNTVGKPIDGVEVVIVDNSGNPVSRGELGIIHVSTPSKFDGYITENTEKKTLYKDWINTGDVGYVNSEDELVIVDRYDDMILYQSHNIYPQHIENIIMNYNDISECQVHINDNKLTCTYTTYNNKKIDNKRLRELYMNLKGQLPKYEIPTSYIHVKKLKKNNVGKLIRIKEKNIWLK